MTLMAASVTMLYAAGSVVGPLPAATAACADFAFKGPFTVEYRLGSDGEYHEVLSFSADGPTVSGRARLLDTNTDRGGILPMPTITFEKFGAVNGAIKGRNIEFTIDWDNEPPGHKFTGTVDDNGFASGSFVNDPALDMELRVPDGTQWGRPASPHSPVNWHSTAPLVCAPPPPVQPPPNGPGRALVYPTPPDVDIDNVYGLEPGVMVTVKNPRTVDTHCKYEAVPRPPTLLQNSVHDFDMKAKGTANFKINGVPTGTTWDVTVGCPNQRPAVLVHVF
jgi:hypothetical protein